MNREKHTSSDDVSQKERERAYTAMGIAVVLLRRLNYTDAEIMFVLDDILKIKRA